MPGGTRAEVFDPDEVGVYHCWNRCVRRARLCGIDSYSGKNYNYRRRWIKKRLKLLCKFFAIEVGFYALMSNHWHLVLRNRPDIVETWSDEEVIRRCLIINQMAKRIEGDCKEPSKAEIQIALNDPEMIAEYRRRLSHISHFVASISEYLSRRINKDDQLSGTLWEGRYSCRRIEDEAGLLATAIYVDLNQIRTGEASLPEESNFTSIGDRINAFQTQLAICNYDCEAASQPRDEKRRDNWLAELTLDDDPENQSSNEMKSVTGDRASDKGLLSIPLANYIELLEETGRQVVAGKAAIPMNISPILERLKIRPEHWIESISEFQKLFGKSIGCQKLLIKRAKKNNRSWIRGVRSCKRVFS